MKTILLLPALLLMVLCVSCVPLESFYPLWDQDHSSVLPGLEGNWVDADGSILKFDKGDAAVYTAIFTSKDGVSLYETHVVALSGKFYLDFYPDNDATERLFKDAAYPSLIPAHFFARIVLEGDLLQLALLDDTKVETRAQAGDLVVPLLKRGDELLLTADTRALQQLMSCFGDDQSVWGENETFYRKPDKK